MTEYNNIYKNLSKTSDFIVLVADKVILIINDKMTEYAGVLKQGSKKNFDWVELIKEYTTLSTSLFNMVGFDHTINYSKKSLLKELIKGKNADYIKKKIEALTNASIKFIEHTHVFLNSLENLSKSLEFPSTSKEIKDLYGVFELIKQTLETLEKKHLPKVLQANSEILEGTTKEGSFENNSFLSIQDHLKNFSISGGFENSAHYQVILGGSDESKVMIGGFHAENYLKQQFIKLRLIQQDLKNLSNKEIEEYLNLHSDFISNLINQANSTNEGVFQNLLLKSGVLDNLFQQFTDLCIVEIPYLLEYHIKRFQGKTKDLFLETNTNDTQIRANYKDEYGNVKIRAQWDPNNIHQSIESALQGIKDIFKLIDSADFTKITRDAKLAFKFLSQITNFEDFEKEYKNLQEDIKIIDQEDFSFESRKNAKNAIKQKIAKIENLNHFPKLTKIIRVNHKKLNQLSEAEYILDLMSAMIPTAKNYEIYCDQIVTEIYNLITEINTLISPDNKFTCIKRPTLIIITGLKAVILDRLQKRFPKSDTEALQKIIKNITSQIGNINLFYDSKNGLNLSEIEKVTKEIVGETSII